MAFGEICHDNDELIDVLCEYMENGCQMKEEYVRRADDFFYYRDHNNCERIYKEMRRYQDENILHKSAVSAAVEDRSRRKAELDKLMIKNGIKAGGRTGSDFYYEEPLDEKLILLLGLGKGVRGNMQYILNELNSSPLFEGYRVLVRTSEETEDVVQQYIKKNSWNRTKPVTKDGDYSKAMETAKYLITEVFFPEGWVKRPGQVYINIWHGTPLKKLGLAKNYRGRHNDGNTQRNFIDADYLLYPNDYTREHMLESYKVKNLMHGKTLMLGYPRSGGMLAASQGDLTELKARLAPNGERIYAYMPTWKDYLPVEEVVAESGELLEYLDEKLADDQILYVNLHHKVSDSLDYSKFRKIKKFPADVDSYELLATTDALITDYSSVFYDYLVLRRQIILYCADYEKYKEVRGTYMDISELPFDQAITKEDVLTALNRGKTYDDSEAFERFCAYDSTENASLLCSVLLGEERVVDRVAPIKADRERSVLIYDESCSDKKSVKLLDEFVTEYAIDGDAYYVGCDKALVNENKKKAYPFLFHTAVIGTKDEWHFGRTSKGALELYEQGKIEYDVLREYLKYEYYLNVHRWFGSAEFDAVVIYNVTDTHRLLTLMEVPAPKLLFLSDAAVEKLESGDEFFHSSVLYAASHCMGVYVCSESAEQAARRFLPDGTQITVVENAGKFRELLENMER
jgi:CDP-glycerol glycerophosphotransferase (TagB/SpsB family)